MRTFLAVAFWLAVADAVIVRADVPVPRFTRTVPLAGQPVVADAATGAYWQGCPAGMTGDASSCTGTASAMEWQAALDYCQDSTWAGFADWYLPSANELVSIADDRRVSPSIDTTAFPATPSGGFDYFWSSSTSDEPSAAGFVGFDAGHLGGHDKTDTAYVRCVRRGP